MINPIAKKGFILFDALIAAMIMTFMGAAITAGCVAQSAMQGNMSHRFEAINYASSAADMLMDKVALIGDPTKWPSDANTNTLYTALKLGTHTDAEICTLPDTYFKNTLKGTMSYEVKDRSAGAALTARMADITVEWQEEFPKGVKRKEVVSIIVSLYKTV